MSPTSPPTLTDQIHVSRDALAFIAALEAADALPDGIPYFLEKPFKWQDDYTAWQNAGRPTEWEGMAP